MNYLQAREKKSGGWHFTNKNDDYIYPVGYCAEHEPHETKEEAIACYRRWLLENRISFDKMDKQKLECVECGEWTQGIAIIDGYHTIVLCDKHRDIDYVDHHLPPQEVLIQS